jgi:hypothetical protein
VILINAHAFVPLPLFRVEQQQMQQKKLSKGINNCVANKYEKCFCFCCLLLLNLLWTLNDNISNNANMAQFFEVAVPQANQYFLNNSDNMQFDFSSGFLVCQMLFFAYKVGSSGNNNTPMCLLFFVKMIIYFYVPLKDLQAIINRISNP